MFSKALLFAPIKGDVNSHFGKRLETAQERIDQTSRFEIFNINRINKG